MIYSLGKQTEKSSNAHPNNFPWQRNCEKCISCLTRVSYEEYYELLCSLVTPSHVFHTCLTTGFFIIIILLFQLTPLGISQREVTAFSTPLSPKCAVKKLLQHILNPDTFASNSSQGSFELCSLLQQLVSPPETSNHLLHSTAVFQRMLT